VHRDSYLAELSNLEKRVHEFVVDVHYQLIEVEDQVSLAKEVLDLTDVGIQMEL
jgi:hypothetical protein